MAEKKIEFWFEYGSTYTYLTVARLAAVSQARGVTVEWRPFLLMPIMIDLGMQQGPFLPFPAKLRYMWRDLERRARYNGILWRRPSAYPPPNVLIPARIGYVAQKEDWCAVFTQEVFRLHWTEDVLIGTDENIRRSLEAVGKNVEDILTIAQSEDTKAGLRRQTEQAKSLGFWFTYVCSVR